MDSVRLESYSKVLAEEFAEDADTLTALNDLVRAERGEFEPKIPELGSLLAMVRRVRSARLEKLRVARESEAWEAHKRACVEEWARDGVAPTAYQEELQAKMANWGKSHGLEQEQTA